ncbi:MAG: hypothetical protein ACM3PP_06580 [Candidatus Saccharibacteria bacterium]
MDSAKLHLEQARRFLSSQVAEHWGTEAKAETLCPDSLPENEQCRLPLYYLWLLNEEIFQCYAVDPGLRSYMAYGTSILKDMQRLKYGEDLHFRELLWEMDDELGFFKLMSVFRGLDNPEDIPDQKLEKFFWEMVCYVKENL